MEDGRGEKEIKGGKWGAEGGKKQRFGSKYKILELVRKEKLVSGNKG